MKLLKEILYKSYERHTAVYDDLDMFRKALRTYKKLSGLEAIQYKNRILTVSIPQRFFTPEVQYYADELRVFLAANTEKKDLRTVKIIAAP